MLSGGISNIKSLDFHRNTCFSGFLVAAGIRASVHRGWFISHNLSIRAEEWKSTLYCAGDDGGGEESCYH